MDKMEIINLHKRNKARKTPQPKKEPKSPKSDDSSKEEQKPKKHQGQSMKKRPLRRQDKKLKRLHSLKKHQSHQSLSMTQARKTRSPKNIRSSVEKKIASKAGKKVKKTPQPKKAPKSPEFIETNDPSNEEQEGPPKKDKGKKIPPLLRVKEEAQGFLDLWKESKKLRIKKKVERIVFMGGPYEDHKSSYVPLYDTKYLERVLKMSGLDWKTKDLTKQALAKI